MSDTLRLTCPVTEYILLCRVLRSLRNRQAIPESTNVCTQGQYSGKPQKGKDLADLQKVQRKMTVNDRNRLGFCGLKGSICFQPSAPLGDISTTVPAALQVHPREDPPCL